MSNGRSKPRASIPAGLPFGGNSKDTAIDLDKTQEIQYESFPSGSDSECEEISEDSSSECSSSESDQDNQQQPGGNPVKKSSLLRAKVIALLHALEEYMRQEK